MQNRTRCQLHPLVPLHVSTCAHIHMRVQVLGPWLPYPIISSNLSLLLASVPRVSLCITWTILAETRTRFGTIVAVFPRASSAFRIHPFLTSSCHLFSTYEDGLLCVRAKNCLLVGLYRPPVMPQQVKHPTQPSPSQRPK